MELVESAQMTLGVVKLARVNELFDMVEPHLRIRRFHGNAPTCRSSAAHLGLDRDIQRLARPGSAEPYEQHTAQHRAQEEARRQRGPATAATPCADFGSDVE